MRWSARKAPKDRPLRRDEPRAGERTLTLITMLLNQAATGDAELRAFPIWPSAW
ncbi:MAG: hypothetical protein ACRDTX_07655 [Pseudonocardiaceae bacterium]